MTDYEIIQIEINRLSPYEKNPNKMSALMKQSLEYSIDKFGLLQPLIIDLNNNIIDGHQRYNACMQKGIKKVNAIRVTNFTSEKDKRLLSQALNKIKGKHDRALDEQDLISILKANDEDPIEIMRLIGEDDERKLLNLLNNPLYTNNNNINNKKDDDDDDEKEQFEDTDILSEELIVNSNQQSQQGSNSSNSKDKPKLHICPNCGYSM